jgi:23S rRNA (uracil1939-C5)-methyltransferase/tRNA (uracil-5-)-methyltransferase
MGTDEIYEYRNKLTPHYEAPIRVGGDRDTDGDGNVERYELQAIGFQQITTKRLVDVEECPIATPAINDVYKQTRAKLHQQAFEGVLNNKKRRKKHRRSRHKVELGATLLFRQADDDETTGEPVVVTDHSQYMTTTVKGIKFRYLAGNFFQNNDYVVPLMVDGVINAALQPVAASTAAAAASDGNDTGTTDNAIRYLIDCYCGSGLFALCASSKVNLCVGIEVNEKAAEEATDNANRNNIKNCQFVAASAEAIFTSPPALTVPGYESMKIQDFPREETCVVLDPPRKGCSGTFLEQLFAYSPQRIVYMSCGPATQARDAKGIVEVGGYTITSIQPYDLFPMTKHVESLIVFEKKNTTTK